jgi:Fe-S cluster biogenesis protein NfuA
MITIERVESAIDSIRPYLKADGGDIKVLEITEEQVVKVELLGSCGACPMSAMTLRAGVEDAIRLAFPEIRKVEAVNALV